MRRLCDRDLTISTAESCTGGMMAALLTDIEGAGHTVHREEHFGAIGRGAVRVKCLQTMLEMLEDALEQA